MVYVCKYDTCLYFKRAECAYKFEVQIGDIDGLPALCVSVEYAFEHGRGAHEHREHFDAQRARTEHVRGGLAVRTPYLHTNIGKYEC